MAKVRRVIELWNAPGVMGAGNETKTVPKVGKKAPKGSEQSRMMAEAFWYMMSLYDPAWATRIGVHFGLFMPAIQGQGTQEQQDKYMPLITSMKIIGCFAMTELGHGSYIRGFETTSTYDRATEEFIINSPTDTSTKWWIGMAGQTATHAVVFARLIVGEKDHGVHSFVVPIRSLETGEALPGITVGDCGAKMGRNGLDNGFIQFHNVRVPRNNMLMKWAQVSPSGEYTSPPKPQLSYGALIGGRVSMIQDSSDYSKKALTIAIRYSAVRTQFPIGDNDYEEPVLNYQSHQMRLMPLLSTCYALHFTAEQIKKKFEKMTEELEKGNITNLVGVHATSAGLKAFSTWWCSEALELCRQSLGGHGYSAYAALSSFLADFAVMCTWEGDNTVLAQQTAKYLMKIMKHVEAGKEIHGFEKYLQNYKTLLSEARMRSSHLFDHNIQLAIMKRASIRVIEMAWNRLRKERAKSAALKQDKGHAWNECMSDLILAARAHCDFYVLTCFSEAIAEISENQELTPVKDVLTKMCSLHGLILMDRYSSFLLYDKYISSRQFLAIRDGMKTLAKEIRVNAVPLVDAFNFPDFILNSPLGRYDGEVYSNYLETVKKTNYCQGRPSYWETQISPLTNPNHPKDQ
eukprot:TRINITY_DN10585_c0_g1_i1.p1 TRINITY_DN10585_c0_g1~~TRINITY_DN10585_c0_g1_i1.p1  ORF type:complete len:730 (-),score=212.62 TRINITY_DN10585_c0_g1_i1:96-1988(-)